MNNAYVSLDTLKSGGLLNITGTGDDSRLRSLIEASSRVVDRYCNRHFYVYNGTLHFDGTGGDGLLVPDLISIDSGGLKTDGNNDRAFETAWAATDYLLMPSNAAPASVGNSYSRPYTRLFVDSDAGTKTQFPAGVETVQIAGLWGWWLHLARASETADAVADSTTTAVTVSARAYVESGHTLLIDSEQMYVQSYSGNTLTVVRGVNGTTAASHSSSSAIDIYEYPQAVTEATIIQAARLWRRKDMSYSGGQSQPAGRLGLDEDVRMMLGPFRKHSLGVGV